jgi:hypothetical protein
VLGSKQVRSFFVLVNFIDACCLDRLKRRACDVDLGQRAYSINPRASEDWCETETISLPEADHIMGGSYETSAYSDVGRTCLLNVAIGSCGVYDQRAGGRGRLLHICRLSSRLHRKGRRRASSPACRACCGPGCHGGPRQLERGRQSRWSSSLGLLARDGHSAVSTRQTQLGQLRPLTVPGLTRGGLDLPKAQSLQA